MHGHKPQAHAPAKGTTCQSTIHQNKHQHESHHFCPVTTFTSESAKFVCPSSFPTHEIPAAAASHAAWQLITLCFLSEADSGMLAFLTMPQLSQNAFVGPSIGAAKTLKLMSQSNNQLLANLQCNKLTAKCC